MKAIPRVRLTALIWVVIGGLLTGGCWPAQPPSGYRTIHQCAINGDVPGVAAELAKYPDAVNLPEDDGLTPLHLAAMNCHADVVALLLDHGAEINVRARDQATPLHLAAQEGCTNVVALLLARGAGVNLLDNQGRTPLKRAEQWHQDACADLLKSHGGKD